MSYIVEYTTLSGKKIAMVHKTYERIEEAIAQATGAVKNGNYKSYKITEGHKVLPAINRERYPEIPGLEGPFRTLNGGVVYYDPKEGAYYDKDRDMYLSYDEFRQMDTDYSGMKDERDIPVKESLAKLPREDVKKAYQIYAKYMKQGSLGAEAEDIVAHFATTKLGYSEKDADMLAQRAAIMHIDAIGESEDDRDELTKKLFPRKSREEMEKADKERNRKMNQQRFMKPGKPSRSREWGAYEGVNEARGLQSIDWPDEDMARHAENAIRHGMHAHDAYGHVYSMTYERDWMQAHKDELIKMFASYGLATESVTEAEGEGTYARIIYDYSENWGAIDIYKGHEKVDEWDDYFGANEKGNPLAAKFVKMAKANGLDPMTLPLVDENGDIGKFDGKRFKWEDSVTEVSTEKLRDYASAALQDKNKDKADKRWKYAGKATQTVADREAQAAHDRKHNTVKESLTLDYSRYVRSHGKKPRDTHGGGMWMFTTAEYGWPEDDDMFEFSGSFADAKRAAAKWARSKGVNRFYVMESDKTINEKAPKMTGDSFKAQRKKDKEHADAMGRHVKSGRKKSYTSTQRSLAKMRGEELPESVNEDISTEAHHMERDHEVQMARSDLYKTANYAIKLHALLKGVSEEEGLEGWMQAKITKAADYLSSVFHALEYDMVEKSQSEPIAPAESVEETTSAGGIAAVVQPMGKMIKRKKK